MVFVFVFSKKTEEKKRGKKIDFLSLSLSLNRPLLSLSTSKHSHAHNNNQPHTTKKKGVEAALEAVPVLHDESLAYLTAASLMADSNAAMGSAAAFNLTSWPGLSNAAALKMAKNYTAILDPANDPLAASGQAVSDQIDATFGPAVPKDLDPKANATLNALGSFVTAGKADDQAFIDDLNARLAKYNIEFTGVWCMRREFFWFLETRVFFLSKVFFFFNSRPRFFLAHLSFFFLLSSFSLSLVILTGKSITAPERFANGAGLISRAITGMSLSATAVNFAPCLISCVFFPSSNLFVSCRRSKKKKEQNSLFFEPKKKQKTKNSYSVTGVSLTSELVNFAPVGVSVTGVGTTIAAQGVSVNPSVILIQPNA